MNNLEWPPPSDWPPIEHKDFLPFVSQWLEKNDLYMSAVPTGTNMCAERSLKGKLPLRWYQLGDRVFYFGNMSTNVVIDSITDGGDYVIGGKVVDKDSVRVTKGSVTDKGVVQSRKVTKVVRAHYDMRKMYTLKTWDYEDGTVALYKGEEVHLRKAGSKYDVNGKEVSKGRLEPIPDKSILVFEDNKRAPFHDIQETETIVVAQKGKKKGKTEVEWELRPGPALLTFGGEGVVEGSLSDYILFKDGSVIPDNGMHIKVRGRFSQAGVLSRMAKSKLKRVAGVTVNDSSPVQIVDAKKGVYVRIQGQNIVVTPARENDIKPVDTGEVVRGRAATQLAEGFTAAKTPENYQRLIPYLLHPKAVIGRNEDFSDSDKLAGLLVVHPTGSGKTITIVGVLNVWIENNFRLAVQVCKKEGSHRPKSYDALWRKGKKHPDFKKIIVITPDAELVDNAKRELISTRGFVCRLLRQGGNERTTIKKMFDGEPLDPCKEELDFDSRAGRGTVNVSKLSHFISFFPSYVTAGNICPFYVVDGDARSVGTDETGEEEDDDETIKRFESFKDATSVRRMRGNRMTNHAFTHSAVKTDPALFAEYNPFDNAVVLMDEFHNAVNTSIIDSSRIAWRKSLPRLAEALRVCQNSVVVGLTATPIVESVQDLKRGVRILKGKFTGNFIDADGNITPEAFRKMQGYVSFYDIEKDHHLFPTMAPKMKPHDIFQPPCYVVRPMSRKLLRKYKAKNHSTDKFVPNFERTVLSRAIDLKKYSVGNLCVIRKFPNSERWYEAKVMEKNRDQLKVKMCKSHKSTWEREKAGDELGEDDEDVLTCDKGQIQIEVVIEDSRLIRKMEGNFTKIKPADNPGMLSKFMTTHTDISHKSKMKHDAEGDKLKGDVINDYPKLKAVVENIIRFCESGEPGKLIVFSDHNNADLEAIGNALRSRGVEQWDRREPRGKKPRYVLLGSDNGDNSEEWKQFAYSKRYFLEGKWDRRRVGEENADGSYVKVALLQTRRYYQGVDFKNVREVHIVEVPTDMRTYQQMIGRAKRNCSHKSLPKKDWTVRTFLYISSLDSTYDSCKPKVARGGAGGRSVDTAPSAVSPKHDAEMEAAEARAEADKAAAVAVAARQRDKAAAQEERKGVEDGSGEEQYGHVEAKAAMVAEEEAQAAEAAATRPKRRSGLRSRVKQVERFTEDFDDDDPGHISDEEGEVDTSEFADDRAENPLVTINLDFRSEADKHIPDRDVRRRVHEKAAAEAKRYAMFVRARPVSGDTTNTEYYVTADQASWLLAVKNYVEPAKVIDSLKRVSVDCKANAIRTGIATTSCGSIGYDPCENLETNPEYFRIIELSTRRVMGRYGLDIPRIVASVKSRLEKRGCAAADVDEANIVNYVQQYAEYEEAEAKAKIVAKAKKAAAKAAEVEAKAKARAEREEKARLKAARTSGCKAEREPDGDGNCHKPFPIKGKSGCCERKRGRKREPDGEEKARLKAAEDEAKAKAKARAKAMRKKPGTLKHCPAGQEVPPDGCKDPFPIRKTVDGVTCCHKKRKPPPPPPLS